MWKRIGIVVTLTKALGFGAALSLAALAAQRAPVPRCEPVCAVPQSPRNINPAPGLDLYYNRSSVSMVKVAPDEKTLTYTYSCDGRPVSTTLYLCSRHYHCPIENVQGCAADETPPVACTKEPTTGQWIELHTVYAAKVTPRDACKDPQGLTCCLEGPIVVRAFSAKVGDPPSPITGRLAEWSGSDTAKTDACRDVAAQWSFVLGCHFTIPQSRLAGLQAKEAQRLQGGLRVSRDLTLVTPK